MGIKIRNVDRRSVLRRQHLPVHFNSTAGGFLMCAGFQATMVVPFNCHLEEVWFSNDTQYSGSNGFALGICNATTDVVPLAAAGNGLFWSACNTNHLYTAADFPAKKLYKIYPSASFMSQGSLLNITFSATCCQCVFGVTLVVDPTSDVN